MALFFFLSILTKIHATTYYISTDGTNTGSGKSWDTSVNSIAKALEYTSNGDTLFIAEGQYYIPVDSQLIISHGIHIYGGFKGDEKTIDQRIPNNNIVKLFGSTLNSKIVLKNPIGYILIDNIHFENGNAYNDPSQSDPCNLGMPNCFGGILNILSNDPTGSYDIKLSNCHFSKNSSFWGGAIGTNIIFASNFRINIIDCHFKNNYSANLGGAIWIQILESDNYYCSISNCTFDKNSASYGGGAISIKVSPQSNGYTYIDSSNFQTNGAIALGGGAIYVERIDASTSKLFIINSNFINNQDYSGPVGDTGRGGSALRVGRFANIFNCRFESNHTRNSGTINGYWLDIINCAFIDNVADGDGAVVYSTEYFTVNDSYRSKYINCLFYNNISKKNGSVFYHRYPESKDSIVNCIFNNNSNQKPIYYSKFGDEIGSSLFVDNINSDVEPNNFYYEETSDKNVFTYNTQHWYNADPNFIDSFNHDFKLKRCSPIINKGNNNYYNAFQFPLDLNGTIRVLQDTIDIGPYEVSIISPDLIIVNNTCGHEPNGFIEIDSLGMTTPINYNIINSIGALEVNGKLNAGDYNVIIEDAQGCPAKYSITISTPDSIQTFYSILHSLNGEANGSITIDSIKGGASTYSIEWFNGATSIQIGNLLPGKYTVKISDALGCTIIDTILIDFNNNTSNLFKLERNLLFTNNPANQTINILWSGNTSQFYIMIDVYGREVQRGNLREGTNNISIENLPSGCYHIIIPPFIDTISNRWDHIHTYSVIKI